jgi:hypothetical protein
MDPLYFNQLPLHYQFAIFTAHNISFIAIAQSLKAAKLMSNIITLRTEKANIIDLSIKSRLNFTAVYSILISLQISHPYINHWLNEVHNILCVIPDFTE